jgi:hypothetical protein
MKTRTSLGMIHSVEESANALIPQGHSGNLVGPVLVANEPAQFDARSMN